MNKELTIADYIKKITVNEANFDYIKNHPEKKINGTLYEGISKAMQEYADQEKRELEKENKELKDKVTELEGVIAQQSSEPCSE